MSTALDKGGKDSTSEKERSIIHFSNIEIIPDDNAVMGVFQETQPNSEVLDAEKYFNVIKREVILPVRRRRKQEASLSSPEKDEQATTKQPSLVQYTDLPDDYSLKTSLMLRTTPSITELEAHAKLSQFALTQYEFPHVVHRLDQSFTAHMDTSLKAYKMVIAEQTAHNSLDNSDTDDFSLFGLVVNRLDKAESYRLRDIYTSTTHRKTFRAGEFADALERLILFRQALQSLYRQIRRAEIPYFYVADTNGGFVCRVTRKEGDVVATVAGRPAFLSSLKRDVVVLGDTTRDLYVCHGWDSVEGFLGFIYKHLPFSGDVFKLISPSSFRNCVTSTVFPRCSVTSNTITYEGLFHQTHVAYLTRHLLGLRKGIGIDLIMTTVKKSSLFNGQTPDIPDVSATKQPPTYDTSITLNAVVVRDSIFFCY